LFFLAEFMNTITMSAFIVTLFFGGPQPITIGDTTLDIPLVPNGLEGTVWLLLKVIVFLYIYVWFRGTLPRFRYDQLMDLGWKFLIPASLGWFMLLAAQRLADDRGWDQWIVVPLSLAVIIVAFMMMQLAFRASDRNREAEGVQF
jgi:NADH-quinone oxidoreductase subunit H